MRITCPTCNAHYEIDEGLIPPEGRDVQCSSCGTTWFEVGRDEPASAGEASVPGAAEADAGGGGAQAGSGPKVDDGGPAAPRTSRRPAADKAALDILREERAREDRLRAGMQADPPAAEMLAADAFVEEEPAGEDGNRQTGSPRPDLPELDPREAAAAERVRMAAAATRARARDGGRTNPRDGVASPAGTSGAEAGTMTEAEAPDDASDATAAPRRAAFDGAPWRASGASSPAIAAVAERRGRITGRALLPDIEEINSSLRPYDPSAADAAAGSAASGSADDSASQVGFRIGFLAICAAALVLVLIYVFQEPIARGVPALAEPAAGYVAWVDARRLDLEGAVEALTERITPEP